MAQTKILAVACVLLAMSIMVQAEKTKEFTTKVVADAGQDKTAKLGDSGVIV